MDNKQKAVLILIIIFIAINIILLHQIGKSSKINEENIKFNNVTESVENIIEENITNTYKNELKSDNVIENVENKKEDKEVVYENIIGDEDVVIKYEYTSVYNSTRFYTVRNCVLNYIKLTKNTEYSNLYNLLDLNYKKTNNITVENISKYINKVNKNDILIIDEMYEKLGERIEQYVVGGYIVNTEDNSKTRIYILIIFDSINQTYSIVPQLKATTDKEVELLKNSNSIQKNNNNKYEYYRIKEENEVKEYYEFYKKLMLYIPEKAYEYVDKTYKEKRFNNNYEEFLLYIENNKEALKKSTLTKYYYINKTKCKMVDDINNTFIININDAILDFTIKLDDNTLV